jgi:hypothetical protein
MVAKLKLLKEFYCGLPCDRAKIETYGYGFDFLAQLLSGGASMEYGELTLAGTLHKYKILNISQERLNQLLRAHIAKECNVCLYFDVNANNVFCFNLDNNHKTNNTIIIPEMDLAIRTIRGLLCEVGCEPLIIASGRGYHVWCRLNSAVDNALLHQFMIRIAAKTLAELHKAGFDYHAIKFNFYPDTRLNKIVSLRLFGSEHAKNKTFSFVYTPDGLLDETASWEYFSAYLQHKTISTDEFAQAYAKMAADFAVKD